MSAEIRFTETAKEDLRSIAYCIEEQSKDKETAVRFVKALQERCRALALFPESGAIPKDRILKSQGYRFLVHQDYLIFYVYDAKEKTVYILAVLNAKQDYMRVMKRFV